MNSKLERTTEQDPSLKGNQNPQNGGQNISGSLSEGCVEGGGAEEANCNQYEKGLESLMQVEC